METNEQQTEGRDERGRFAPGNPGGPGRPRRAVEVEYLRVLSDSCTLTDWAAIVGRAVEDAKQGDARARDWIASRVLGESPMSLVDVLRRDMSNITVEEELNASIIAEHDVFTMSPAPIVILEKERQWEHERELQRAEAERRRLAREQRKRGREQQPPGPVET